MKFRMVDTPAYSSPDEEEAHGDVLGHSADAALLRESVQEAGAHALKLHARGFRQWEKPDGSLLTDVDIAIDKLLKKLLHDPRPGYGWLSEESPDDLRRLEAQRCWVLDPIDGTRAFARNGATWCVGAALVEHGRPVLSCIFHPQISRLYFAEINKGATLNNQPVKLADVAVGADRARVMGPRRFTDALARRGATIVPAMDTPLLARFAMLASGELDAIVATAPKQDWDLAPGELLATEAGGKVTDLLGRDMIYNQQSRMQEGLVASASRRHKAVLDIVERA
jgi:myo-inositol-1(or 4)-monophosphatase